MILSDFLSRQQHNDNNPHEIIPISFNMYNILPEKYYNIGDSARHLVQTWSQVKSSRIKLPEVHGVSKSLDPNIQPEKQIAKPLFEETSQVKPRIEQRRAGSRCKKLPINQLITQSAKNLQKIPELPILHMEVINMAYFTAPVQSLSNPGTETIKRKMIQKTCRHSYLS